MAKTSPASIQVVWLIAAQDQLENALSQACLLLDKSVDEQAQCVVELRESIDDLLRRSFTGAEAIVVLERLTSFSNRPNSHTLRVEVENRATSGNARPEAFVVKVGPCRGLCKELEGRRSCERPANDRGRTLLNVKPGYCPHECPDRKGDCEQAQEGDLGTIVYQDANHTLRAGRVVSLEQAFLNCVRWGSPNPAAILAVLDQVFHELHNLCYERAPAVSLSDLKASTREAFVKRLEKGLGAWQKASSIAGERRVEARYLLPRDCLPFVDLLDFHQRAFRQEHYQPMVRIGRAHGDLHGRNIMVGLVNGEARWPAVLDFEDMAVNNYVAWDFVKMETELKIRALRQVFTGSSEGFVRDVYDFELRLNLATEERDKASFDSWQDAETTDWADEPSRLLALLLGLRRRAKRYLQVLGPPRGGRWLHEYYFFLACYGVYAGKFKNYVPKEYLAAYLGASCAATRFAWGVNRVYQRPADGKANAQQQLDCTMLKGRLLSSTAASPPATPNGVPPADVDAEMAARGARWDVYLEELKTLARSRTEVHIRDAVSRLKALSEKIPSSAEIAGEWAFAMLELADVTGDPQTYGQAVEVLTAFEQRQQGLYSRDVETLGRWGRLWKDCGDRAESPAPAGAGAASAGQAPIASRLDPAQWYRMSAAYYNRAYRASKDYYPGVNLATLKFLISVIDRSVRPDQEEPGGSQTYDDLAREIKNRLETTDQTPAAAPRDATATVHDNEAAPEPADAHWRAASLGEVCLLLGHDSAYDHYHEAWNHQNTDAHARESIQKQAERIMRHQSQPAMEKIHERLRNLFAGHPSGEETQDTN